MSSRFVSGGVVKSNGETVPGEPEKGDGGSTSGSTREAPKNAEWEAVQKELEAERKRREEKRVKAASGEEKSLYDILQANKEAKQAAFEEQNKIRNQFRALDDDEIDFLDEVREKQRKEEAEKRKELEDGLKAFREARKGEEVLETADDGVEQAEESWEVGGRKRKRAKGREGLVKGVRRKVEDSHTKEEGAEKETTQATELALANKSETKTPSLSKESSEGGGSKALGLVGYGSDDSDDE